MNRKSVEKLTTKSETTAHARSKPPVLRVIPKEERSPTSIMPAKASREVQSSLRPQPQWDDDDKDPGPTAA